jgi:hypothetical protein
VQVFEVEKIILDNELFSVDKQLAVSGQQHPQRRGIVLYSFIRKRSQGTFHSYALTTVKKLDSGEQVELKQVITGRMYSLFSIYADKERQIVKQRRYYFLYEQQSFHIYEYIAPENGLWTLQCQSQLQSPKLPPALKVSISLILTYESISIYLIGRQSYHEK